MYILTFSGLNIIYKYIELGMVY